MSLAPSERNLTSLPLNPEQTFESYGDRLEILDRATEELLAQQVDAVPTVETHHEISHNGVKGVAHIAWPEDISLSAGKHGNLVVNGYMATGLVYRKYGRALTSVTHAPTVTMDLPLTHGGIRRFRDYHPDHIFNPFRLEGQIVAAASRTLHELRQDEPDTDNVIGHSKGGGVASEYAAEKPHQVNKLVLNKSVGIVNHTFSTMTGRALNAAGTDIMDYIKQLEKGDHGPIALSSIKHYLSSPGRLLIQGHRAATTTRLHNDIASAAYEGVQVLAQWGMKDPFFDYREEIASDIMMLIDKGILMDTNHVPEQAEAMRAAIGTAYLMGTLATNSLTFVRGGLAG